MKKIEENIIQFKAIKENTEAELVEKKSRFIANIFYVENVEEAEECLKQIKKKYNDARHHCFAYAIETGDGGIAVKYNDDGEPQGTAGAPILKIILEKGMSNTLVVVTRYFGGTLLGTGGLVRAYSDSTKMALEKTGLVNKTKGCELKITVEYDALEPLKYYLEKSNIKIVKIEYLEKIEVVVETLKEKLVEITNNYNNNFNIIKCELIKEKFIEI